MATQQLTARATLEQGMLFRVQSGSGHEIMLESSLEGENTAASPMEAVLMALAGCMSMSTLSILRKKRLGITSYEVRISSQRSEGYPRVFTEIQLEHIFSGAGLTPQAVEQAIELAEERYCPVSAMLSKTAMIENTYQIIEQ
jgi:putative redox protein